tara:strand:- start:289 stop:2205 length:1917 start_codon:yes stop_codon:yes gene_type:complete
MSNKRYFSKSQRDQIFHNSKGKCQKCGIKITYKGFQADHIIPHSKGGKTEIKNGQALCQKCNSSKSNKMQIENKNYFNYLPTGIELRRWQEDCIPRILNSIISQINLNPDSINAFMLHAFPGTGKTLLSTLVAKYLIEEKFIDQVIICVPSKQLRRQMERDGREVGLWLNKKTLETRSFHGIVCTYSQVGNVNRDTGHMLNAEILRDICDEKRTMVIADECHHLSDQKNWGESFQNAFSRSVARLMTTGTPFRSDGTRLPWVNYRNRVLDLSPPHGFSYGYGFSKWNKSYCALADKVVRDVVIVPWDGEVNFAIKEYREGQLVNEEEYSLRMSTNVDEEYKDEIGQNGEIITNRSDLRSKLKSKRRKAVIACGTTNHPHGTEYVRKQLIAANDQLNECRRMHPHAGGLIVCDGINHANAIANALKHLTGEESVVVHSENGKDARAIEKFTEDKTPSRTKWIIAVGMISEGVDIPHLRVCVYLSSIQAQLRWTQIIGRIIRVEKELDWELQTAYMFQYDDGISTVISEEGEPEQTSVNIRKYAEDLTEEKWTALEARESERRTRRIIDGTGSDTETKLETISASGINTEQIYEGERVENKKLEPLKVLQKRLNMAAPKIYKMIKDGTTEEWLKALQVEE